MFRLRRPVLAAKILLFTNIRNCVLTGAVPPPLEGRIAIVTDEEAGCDGRVGVARRAARARTAKSRGPDAPTLASSLEGKAPQRRRGLSSPAPRGERGISRNTIAQGMPGVSAALSLLACVKCTFFARKARGCSQHPAFPAPSCL